MAFGPSPVLDRILPRGPSGTEAPSFIWTKVDSVPHLSLSGPVGHDSALTQVKAARPVGG